MEDIAKKIKDARLKKGISQADLAQKLFLSKQSISKYENNRSVPSDEIIDKLEEILDVRLKERVLVVTHHKYNIFPILLLSFISLTFLVTSIFIYIRLNSLEQDYANLDLEYDLLQSQNEQLDLDLANLRLDYNQQSSDYQKAQTTIDNLDTAYQDLYDHYELLTRQTILEYTNYTVAYNNSYDITNSRIDINIMVYTTDTFVHVLGSDFTIIVQPKGDIDGIPVNHEINGVDQSIAPNGTYNFNVMFNNTIDASEIASIELFYKGMLVSIITL